MKRAWRAAAYVCGGAMGAAVGMWGAGWCPWLTCAMLLLGCGGLLGGGFRGGGRGGGLWLLLHLLVIKISHSGSPFLND